MKQLAKIGDWVEIDEFTVAPVEGYVFRSRLSSGDWEYHSCWQGDDESWYVSHPTNPLGSPVRLWDKDVSKIACQVDYSQSKAKETK